MNVLFSSLFNFLNNDFRKKKNIIQWNYIKNTTIYQV